MENFDSWCVKEKAREFATGYMENDLDIYSKRWRVLKLTESDFMGLGDTPTMSSEWVNFRQSLRDLPSNVDYFNGLYPPSFVPLDPNGK